MSNINTVRPAEASVKGDVADPLPLHPDALYRPSSPIVAPTRAVKAATVACHALLCVFMGGTVVASAVIVVSYIYSAVFG